MPHTLDPVKFIHPEVTVTGADRAYVDLKDLKTLWFNTGTRCNLECEHCYIESSPTNDRLTYLTLADVERFLRGLAELPDHTYEIGFTGGEPLINPDIIPMLDTCLARGFEVLVLTNGFKVIGRHKAALQRLRKDHGARLCLRVSLDHYSRELHDRERGPGTFAATLAALKWLADQGFNVGVAGRSRWGEDLYEERRGYLNLFEGEGIDIDTSSGKHFVIFPEMDETVDVPEITTACWGILGKRPTDVMCASSRMVVKHRGEAQPSIQSCTLLAYDPRFRVGDDLTSMRRRVYLNHAHCAKFCVLGGASCSGD